MRGCRLWTEECWVSPPRDLHTVPHSWQTQRRPAGVSMAERWEERERDKGRRGGKVLEGNRAHAGLDPSVTRTGLEFVTQVQVQIGDTRISLLCSSRDVHLMRIVYWPPLLNPPLPPTLLPLRRNCIGYSWWQPGGIRLYHLITFCVKTMRLDRVAWPAACCLAQAANIGCLENGLLVPMSPLRCGEAWPVFQDSKCTADEARYDF